VLMTLAEYARHRGCDKKAVQFAIERGRIKRNEDGSIDSDRADLDWQSNTHHAMSRHGPKPPRSQPIFSAHARRDPAVDIAAGTLRRKQTGGPAGSGLDFLKARAIKATYEARLKKLAFEEKQGNLLSKQDVERMTFDRFRVLRDGLLNLPDRISGQLAAESQALKVQEMLKAEVRLALEKFVGVGPPVDQTHVDQQV
jgi:hypothetical protein